MKAPDVLKIAQILRLKANALGRIFVKSAQKYEQKFILYFSLKISKALAKKEKVVYNKKWVKEVKKFTFGVKS